MDDQQHDSDGGTGRLKLENLQFLVLQPDTLPERGACGTPRMQYGSFVHGLYEVHAKSVFRWAILPDMEGPTSPKHWEQLAKAEWLERGGGGTGCWAMPDATYFNDV